ncbi:MAG: DoxX family membrane protein [Patescibacteria group bacterium]
MPRISSAVIVRYTLTLLFLWFGTQQLIDPSAWIGFLPEWVGYIPVPAETFVRLNGLMEVVFALLLGIGAYTRIAAAILGLHLLGIAISVGNATGVRDAALALCTLSIALNQPDERTLDARTKKD